MPFQDKEKWTFLDCKTPTYWLAFHTRATPAFQKRWASVLACHHLHIEWIYWHALQLQRQQLSKHRLPLQEWQPRPASQQPPGGHGICFQHFTSDICFLICWCVCKTFREARSSSIQHILPSKQMFVSLCPLVRKFLALNCYYSSKKITHSGKIPLPVIFFYNVPPKSISTYWHAKKGCK